MLVSTYSKEGIVRKVLWMLVLLLTLSSCQKEIDGSSEEAFKQSIDEMKGGMTDAEEEEFNEALMIVAMKDLDFGAMMAGVQDGESMMQDARRSLEGKSAEEIVAWADEIRARRAEEEKRREEEQLEQEIADTEEAVEQLRTLKKQAEAAQANLKKFTVTEARFYKRKQRYGGPQPVIELKVTNNTDQPVARAYFNGTLKSPGRAVAWHEDTFNYSIPGGLEPGESAHWKLEPNMFSDWGSAEAGEAAMLKVEVIRLDGPNEETLFDASGWSDEEERRLTTLVEFLANPTAK